MRPEHLVVLGSSVTALALVRSAHRLGVRAEIADVEDGVAFRTRLAVRLPRFGAPRARVLEELLRMQGGRRAWLVATTDEWLRALHARRTDADRAFERVLHPSNAVLETCLDKARFAAFCAAHGLPSPRAHPPESDLRDATFPLLLRPAETLHSRPAPGIVKAREVGTRAELRASLAAFRAAGVAPILTESLLHRPLEQFSVGLSRRAGRALAVVARKLRPPPQACRVGTLVESADEPAVEALALRTAELLDYEGIAEVEVLRTADDGALHLVEVNARPWVQFGIGAAAGRDLLGFQLGATPRATPPQRQVRWISFPDDLWLCMNREHGLVRTGAVSWTAYAASILGARAYARWAPNDPGPFLHGLREILGPRLARAARALSLPGP